MLRLQKTLIFWSTNPLKIFKNCVGKCLWKHMLILHRILKVLASMLGRQEGSFLLWPSHLFCYFFQYVTCDQDMPQAAPRRSKRLLRRIEDPPRALKCPPKRTQNTTKTSPRAQNTPRTSPRGSQDGFSRGPGQSKFGWKCFDLFLTYFTRSNPKKYWFSLSILKVMCGLLEGFLYLHYLNAQL